MSEGRIVHEPLMVRGHECRPPGPDSLLETDLSLSDHPSGTVWECVCGKTWVSGRGGLWHRERRFARWRRERRDHREQNRELDADGLPPWGPDRWQEPRSDKEPQ